jgi:hypothetical protein
VSQSAKLVERQRHEGLAEHRVDVRQRISHAPPSFARAASSPAEEGRWPGRSRWRPPAWPLSRAPIGSGSSRLADVAWGA